MKLKQDIKRMLDALALQNAGDFLPYDAKLQMLGVANDEPTPARLLPVGSLRNARRIAWLTDGTDQSLDYAIEVCSRQKAEMDLVLHGSALVDQQRVSTMQSRVSNAGIYYQSIVLPGSTFSELTAYLGKHTNLLYLVASIANPLAMALKDNLATGSNYLKTPLVFFDK